MTTKENQQTAVVKQTDITAQVLAKINLFKDAGELKIPEDYSPENALKSAFLILSEATTKDGKPVLEACTKTSIANSLLKMVTLGLSPMKKQGDFIPYGTKLTFQEEYTGNIALAKRYGGLASIKGNAIFKGDNFVYKVNEFGRKEIVEHEQKIENLGGEILGAYAVIQLVDGTVDVEVMGILQIKNAWNQGQMKGQSGAHKNFADQMAIKTVINRACKLLIRGSNDSIFMGSDDEDTQESSRSEQIKEQANQKVIDIEEAKFEEVTTSISSEQLQDNESGTESQEVPELQF